MSEGLKAAAGSQRHTHPADTSRQSQASSQRPAAVYFFGTCLVDLFFPGAGLDAIALLEREGVHVIYPEGQTCCGQPAWTSGYPDQARAVAAVQLDLFPEPWPIIVPSGSCAGMMKLHAPGLFADDPVQAAKAADIASRVFELTGFLVEGLKVDLRDTGQPARVAIHTSCSARREMGTHVTSRVLLDQLVNVEVVTQVREAECCGFGGTFSLREPEISAAMVQDKTASLRDTGADAFVTADCGCLANIKHAFERQPRPVAGSHIATFLRQRTDDRS